MIDLPSSMTLPQSAQAQQVLTALTQLQGTFRRGLDALSERWGDQRCLKRTTWLRDAGGHGGGWRFEGTDLGILNRGSLNISSVHYDDVPTKRLSSATALSCIVHPADPRAPSLHTHISWTELRDGEGGGWRLMADLNPSLSHESSRVISQRDTFLAELTSCLHEELTDEWVEYALAQGDRYFWIPSLDRHRGVAHLYLEQWKSGDEARDLALAERFGARVIETYLGLLEGAFEESAKATDAEREAQLTYHSAYFFQVLTLDRGTSSGILVHNQNDVGILGSLPQRVDREQLASWVERLSAPQDALLTQLLGALPPERVCELTPEVRAQLAGVVREHYRAHPEALALQARGDILPPTVANHHSERSETR